MVTIAQTFYSMLQIIIILLKFSCFVTDLLILSPLIQLQQKWSKNHCEMFEEPEVTKAEFYMLSSRLPRQY